MSNLKTLQKLLSYSAMVGAVVVPITSDAQVVFKDLIPDVRVDNFNYSIDFLNTGVADFNFFHFSIYIPGSSFRYSVHRASFDGLNNAALFNKNPFGLGDTIKPAIGSWVQNDDIALLQWWNHRNSHTFLTHGSWSSWYISTYFTWTSNTYSGGAFLGKHDTYIGVKFPHSYGTSYGWIRIGIDAGCSEIIVKSYAYQSMPDYPIIAGDTMYGVGVNDLVSKEIHSYIQDEQLKIDLPTSINKGVIQLHSIEGRLLLSESFEHPSHQINIGEYSSAFYLLKIVAENEVLSKKIYIGN